MLSLATVRNLPAHIEYFPLVATAPEAAWTDVVGGKKKFSEVIWSSEKLSVREFSDRDFRRGRDRLRRRIRRGGRNRTGARRSARPGTGPHCALRWRAERVPAGGITTTPITGDDPLDAIDKAMAAVEATGIAVTGIVGGPSIATALRQAYRDVQALPSMSPANELFGVPLHVSPVWDSSRGDVVVGNFDYLVIGVRSDVTAETSTDGVLTNDAGEIVISAFESDSTLIRCHGRFAAAIGKPVGANGTAIQPFATASWSDDSTRAAAAPAPATKKATP